MNPTCLRDGYADGQYILPPLPYELTALEPLLDAETLDLHHSRHHAAYVAGANEAVARMRRMARGEEDDSQVPAVAQQLAFHLAGHMMHMLYWGNMSPERGHRPECCLAAAINASFGSYEGFARVFRQAALGVQGSGWAVLATDAASHELVVLAAHRHQDALLPRMRPLLVCDVWEHAYYLRYMNNRARYVDAFMNQICWRTVEKRFNHSKEKKYGCQ